MDTLRTGVFVLSVLLLPVSCENILFTEPVTCYFLDGFLIFYCIIATAFFLRERFLQAPSAAVAMSPTQEDNGAIYQEIAQTRVADPYQVLEQPKRKKKAAKNKKPQSTPVERDGDPFESLTTGASAPPLSSD